jgi:hypothetical protein
VVYATRPTDVRATVVDGQVVYQDGELTWSDRRDIRDAAHVARKRLRERAGV